MEGQFKQCSNGHYYIGASCPYCKSSTPATGGGTAAKTDLFVGGMDSQCIPSQENGAPAKTEILGGGIVQGDGNSAKTEILGSEMFGGGRQVNQGQGNRTVFENGNGGGSGSSASPSNRTVFGDETIAQMSSQNSGNQQPEYRSTRKFVGWLVSYTLDPMGVDFKIYEGRNIIGRDMECNISINDNMVSSKHALLLFRAGKYSITDQQSTHGTFVNERDIDLEPCYLQDGDEIRMGKTILKFRSSL